MNVTDIHMRNVITNKATQKGSLRQHIKSIHEGERYPNKREAHLAHQYYTLSSPFRIGDITRLIFKLEARNFACK